MIVTTTTTTTTTTTAEEGTWWFLIVLFVVGLTCTVGPCIFFVVCLGKQAVVSTVWKKEKLEGDPEEETNADIEIPSWAAAPAYWRNQDLEKEFEERVQADHLKPVVQEMFDRTWKDIVTRDRKGGTPVSLDVVSVERVEDQQMWVKYLEKKESIRKRRGKVTKIRMLDGVWSTGKVLTDKFVTLLTGNEQLDETVNEHFLFHGTSPQAAENIAEAGFRINLAGTGAGTMFGKGAYFAECSSKADEYSVPGEATMLSNMVQAPDEYAILLCRVCMGEVFRAYRARERAEITRKIHDGDIDGVLGDREEAVGTYREFVVYTEAQIYPEYRVLYQHNFHEAAE